ncbi:MAG: CtsR family transcriptional regulator [Saccharofermentanales bacterium]|jgi:transcriptional regulator CtsR|nr:CtsR family transcriptional regulator [Clostridiaceae bacterium]
MSRISDYIEALLKEMMDENNGLVEISRNSLADRINCVPSQITYVLSTRFTNDQGYLVESRRGGGGWIRIRRVKMTKPTQYLMHAMNTIGDRLSQHQIEVLTRNFLDYEIIEDVEARLLQAATSDRSLSEIATDQRDRTRVAIFKNMLTSLIVR